MISKKLTNLIKIKKMAATERRLWGAALALSLSLLCIFAPMQVWAVQKNLEFRNLFAALGKQTLEKINAETGPNANLRKFTASGISSTLFRSFYADSSLINTLPEAYLVGVKQAQGVELARFRSIDLVQCYAEHKGGVNAFLSGMRNLGRDLNIILDWDDPKVIKAATKVYGCISKLDAQDITIAASSHYRANDWSGEIRFSWYPTDGMARLYAVITFSGPINVKTAILSASGRIFTQKHKPFSRAIILNDYSLNLSTRTLNASGSYCLPHVPDMNGSGTLFIDNNCRLKVQNFEVSGRVLETIAQSGQEGNLWNIEYVLSGNTDRLGNMSGTCIIKGKQAAFNARFGNGVKTDGATWKASRHGKLIKGVINVGGSHTISWQASIND